jgi:hypothetical protein
MRPHIGAAFVFSVFACACGGIDRFEHVITDSATIPGTINMGPFSLNYGGAFNGTDLSKAETFRNNDVSPDDVDGIFIQSVTIQGTKPIDRLDVLFEAMELAIEAPGLPRLPIASKRGFERSNASGLNLDTNQNIKDYATSETMTVTTNVDIKQQPAFETTIETTVTLIIDINLPL